MWNIRQLILFFVLCVVLNDATAARKGKKPKRPKPEDEPTTPQPNIVTYSSFGFNDVGQTYDGFVPSSPDYASYLSGFNQETSTRLYAPAFPTANDNEAYNNLYGQQNMDQQSYSNDGNNGQESDATQYEQSFNYMNQFGNGESSYQGMSDVLTDKNSDDGNSPIYGAKLGSRNRNRLLASQHNQTNYEPDIITLNNEGSFNPRENNYGQHESKLSYGDSRSPNNYYNPYNYGNSYSNNEDATTTAANNNNKGSLRYQKVVDFTKFKPTYPTELETKYNPATFNPLNVYDPISNSNDNKYTNNDNKYHSNNNDNNWNNNDGGEAVSSIKFAQSYDNGGADDSKASLLDISINHVDQSNTKNAFRNTKLYSDYKDQFKNRPSYNFSTDYSNNWKAPWKNDYSNSTSVRYDYTNIKSHNSGYTDEVASSSNNVPDYASYKFPDHDYSNFKKFPTYKPQSDHKFKGIQSSKYSDDSEDFLNQYKNYLTTSPTTTNWLNYFKNSEIESPYAKPKQKRPQYGEDGIGSTNDEVVHIPKKPHKYRINKNSNKHKGKHPSESNRFKSEEDLLGLRNHDTANPPYMPSFKLNEDFEKEFQKYASENSYKKLAEKWRQSYLNSYQKYSNNKDFGDEYEAYASESRPMHYPVPKPYPIEIPHPVIVPVPQPYPVRVPVPKPVAVPYIREITVPIEKPVPYPVYKKVPYPVEKPVPVQVEKEVQVPVMKPYPVPIPHVRPVFHHSKHSHEDLDLEPDASMAEEDYYPSRPERPERPDRPERPERYEHGPKKVVRYLKKPRSSRNRSRRPSPSHQYERTRRRWPARTPPVGFRREYALAKARRRRPSFSSSEHQYAPSFRYKSYEGIHDNDDDDDDRR